MEPAPNGPSGSIGNLKNRHFIIDTGATKTVVNGPIARKLKLKGRPRQVKALGKRIEVQEVVLPRLKIGSEEFQEVPAQVAELSGRSSEGFRSFLGMNRALRVDTLIGLEVLRRSSLSIDYKNSTIHFGPVAHSPSTCRLYPQVPFAFAPVRVARQRIYLMLDTGALDLVLFKTRVQGRLPLKRTGGVNTVRYLGGIAELRKIRLSKVSMGATQWEELPAFLLDGPDPELGLDGVVGPSSLDLSRLNLDFANNLISWER